ncbi:hypothetical protein, unlikely [Trypanosoma brucei gambiense DAL972]|uniref:Uncharacterized protein n=1 Tax=Trypanosoma brucei gambiense (strain MHOM/CI/86/DAL972) TaxID=679716 RepID=D0A6E9_TRYB9|nr:hypothetical protein, unlikely [Trypanosoma brucei gambiense DAL972]CBH17250.1 hypothetical protein, unlikely [Trypanosoma brucei gambiense DAL972]|eukprot:XP_011779514.1 hypothetical protein, unlikely [Trypanosoma brucei gambiense DAL972]
MCVCIYVFLYLFGGKTRERRRCVRRNRERKQISIRPLFAFHSVKCSSIFFFVIFPRYPSYIHVCCTRRLVCSHRRPVASTGSVGEQVAARCF